MYETKEMNYNTKEKPIYTTAVKTNIFQKRNNVTRVDCIKQQFRHFYCMMYCLATMHGINGWTDT